MAQYVAFLRAVNVAGHGRVKMNDVREAFIASGGGKVRTYIQSGNILFEATARNLSKTMQKVRGKLRALLGEEPKILLRSVRDLSLLVDKTPFARPQIDSDAKLYVTFLSQRPRHVPVFPLRLPKEALEAIAMKKLDVFIVSRPKKNGFFGFPNNFIEKELGVMATSRNWSTVCKIVSLAREPQ